MSWFEEKADDVSRRVMGGLDASIGGTAGSEEFWLVALNKNKSNPIKRYEAALKGLPYPAAFREAILGLRAVIREKAKSKEDYEKELAELYRIAVLQSFGMKYSERAQVPGFNILERIPGSLIASLEYEYQTMGYEKLELINKTDAKGIVSLWGEPKNHTTLLDLHNSVWKKYEDEFIYINKKEDCDALYNINSNYINQQETRSDKTILKQKSKVQEFISRIFKGK